MNQLFVSNHQDNFNILKTLMEMHIPQIRKPNTPGAYAEQTAQSIFELKSNPYTFQSDLHLYYQKEASYGRTYLDMEKTNVFLWVIKSDTRFTKVTLDIRNVLLRKINGIVPHEYRFGHIAETIYNHASVEKWVGLDAHYSEAIQPYIKSTEAPFDDTEATIHCINGKEKRPKHPHVQCLACNT